MRSKKHPTNKLGVFLYIKLLVNKILLSIEGVGGYIWNNDKSPILRSFVERSTSLGKNDFCK
jgi:hypothetical protein